MKIKEKVSQHRRDFHAVYECEHCGAEDEGDGYDDAYFHRSVIPAMTCRECGRSADGPSSTPDVPAGVVRAEQEDSRISDLFADRAEALAEIERLDDVEHRLAVLLCDLTDGKLSKTNYDVRTMVQAIEETFDEVAQRETADLRAELDAALARAEAAEAEVEQWRDRMWATVRERMTWHHDTGQHDDSGLPYMHCPDCERLDLAKRYDDLTAERDALRAQLAAVAALADGGVGRVYLAPFEEKPTVRDCVLVEDLRAALDNPDQALNRVRAEAWDEGAAAPRMEDGSEEPAIDNPYRSKEEA